MDLVVSILDKCSNGQQIAYRFVLELRDVALLVSNLFVESLEFVLQTLHLLRIVPLLVLKLFSLIELTIFLLDSG